MDLLTVVKQCHNHDPWSDKTLTPFLLSEPPKGVQIGFCPPAVVKAVREDIEAGRSDALRFNDEAIWINPSIASSNEETSSALRKLVEGWRDRKLFPDPLKGWRNELYSVYGPGRKEVFRLERSACALFGFATFGVHATAYTPDYKIWVPRRAKDKSTWPGYLDNSAAGGITAGDDPFESMVREFYEEAGLPADLVRKSLRQTGVITYFYRTESGWVQPEVEYTYDLPVDPNTNLHPVDGEAEDFQLMDQPTVMKLLRQGKFKANCALVLIDFYVRHGLLQVEDCDCDYTQLVSSMHNDLRLPGP